MNQGSLTLVGRSVDDVLDDVYHDELLDEVSWSRAVAAGETDISASPPPCTEHVYKVTRSKFILENYYFLV